MIEQNYLMLFLQILCILTSTALGDKLTITHQNKIHLCKYCVVSSTSWKTMVQRARGAVYFVYALTRGKTKYNFLTMDTAQYKACMERRKVPKKKEAEAKDQKQEDGSRCCYTYSCACSIY